jgi:hypothetical protein
MSLALIAGLSVLAVWFVETLVFLASYRHSLSSWGARTPIPARSQPMVVARFQTMPPQTAETAIVCGTQLALQADPDWTLDEILVALRLVETGGLPEEGRHAVGDGGAAIGPFQIHRAYWQDAAVPGKFEDCRDLKYARNVVVSYWRRHCLRALQALDAEILVRIHNGGPAGHHRRATRGFWRKVERELVKQREDG